MLEFTKGAYVLLGDKVNGNTTATETTATSDSVDVVLQVAGQVVVDHKGHLLTMSKYMIRGGGGVRGVKRMEK